MNVALCLGDCRLGVRSPDWYVVLSVSGLRNGVVVKVCLCVTISVSVCVCVGRYVDVGVVVDTCDLCHLLCKHPCRKLV